MLKRTFKDDLSPDGQVEARYILGLKSGAKVVLSSFGATVTSVLCPDKNGEVKDVVLGFDTRAEYASKENPYFGSIVGRVANRTNLAQFEMDGKTVQLAKNCLGKHHLHGGL